MTDRPRLWAHIRDTLRREIDEGRYPLGSRLPTEAALARRFAVNRHTVRRATAALGAEGAVHARRGAGVFVTGTQVAYRLSARTRFSQNMSELGQAADRRILRLETLPGSPQECDALHLPAGAPVHLMEAVGEASGVPLTYARSVFPATRLPGLVEALSRTRSVTRALAACDVADYRRQHTAISALLARGDIAHHLQVSDGAPLLQTRSLNVDADGTPVEAGRTWFAAERVDLTLDTGAP